jgi:hypothetical protein
MEAVCSVLADLVKLQALNRQTYLAQIRYFRPDGISQ